MTQVERERTLQGLQDSNGYVVIAHRWQHEIGSVLRNCEYSNGDKMPVVVVTGYTSEDDFVDQVMASKGVDFTRDEVRQRLAEDGLCCFHKVVAE